MYLLLILIAVVSAQFINIIQEEIDSTAQMSVDNQNDYIKNAIRDKLINCTLTCIRSESGCKKTHPCSLGWLRLNCNKDCQKEANDIKISWTEKSNTLRKNRCLQKCAADTQRQGLLVRDRCYRTRCSFLWTM
jgi:hypothetical protein